MYLFKIAFLFSWAAHPGVGLLDHTVVLFFTFRTLSNLFHSSCTKLQSHQPCARVPFSPYAGQPLPVVELFVRALKQVRGHSSLWIWFAFLWWLAVLSIFLCGHVYFLYENVHSDFLPIKKNIYLFIFLFFTVPGLGCCPGFSLVVASGGYSRHGATATPPGGFSCCRA